MQSCQGVTSSKKTSFSSYTAKCKGLQLPPAATGCTSTVWGAVSNVGGPRSHSPPAAWVHCSRISPPKLLGAMGSRSHRRSPRRPNSPCPTVSPDQPAVTPVVGGIGSSASPSVTPPPPMLLSHECPHNKVLGRTCHPRWGQLGRVGDRDGHCPFGLVHSVHG